MMRGGNRKMRRQMDKMGLQMEEMSDVREVIIRTNKNEIILPEPAVSRLKIKEGYMYTVSADTYEEKELEVRTFPDEDIEIVSQRAGVSDERAKEMLAETDGDVIEAIVRLQ